MEKEKKPFYKKKLFWGIVVVVVFVIAASSGGGDDTTTTTVSSTEAPTEVVANNESENDAKESEVTEEPTEVVENNENDKKEEPTEEKEVTTEEDADATQESELTPQYVFEALASNDVFPYTVSEKASAFLGEHSNLFPATKESKVKKYANTEITYRHLAKNSSKYGDKLMFIENASVISCTEEELSEDQMLTEMQIYDMEGNNFMVFYIGELSDVLEGDTINCYGLPLGTTSFENVSGGTTLAGVLAGSYVEKIN